MENERKQLAFHWSGGKDSMLALHKLNYDPEFHVRLLLTNFSEESKRVSMHGVRPELIEKQAALLGIPLDKLYYDSSNYESKLDQKLNELKSKGFLNIAYGDIFLEDLKQYRDQQLSKLGLQGVYPLWKMNSLKVYQEFVSLGFKAIIICINTSLLSMSVLGKTLDLELLKSFPDEVDPCGENGEFHTFVYDGPGFSEPMSITKGEIVKRSYPDPSFNKSKVEFAFLDITIN